VLVEKLGDAFLERAADFVSALLAEGEEQVVDEGLGFAFFVAGDVLFAPVNELPELGFPPLLRI
jgi:hypothetical protein